jgi:hypothetical protein
MVAHKRGQVGEGAIHVASPDGENRITGARLAVQVVHGLL